MKTKKVKKETTEERLARFAREYEEVLARRTPEDTDWMYEFVKNYIKTTAPARQDYTAEACYSGIQYARKDADIGAKDVKSGIEYRDMWGKIFTKCADIYYEDYLKYELPRIVRFKEYRNKKTS
jgi:hypothetical protein